MKLPLSALVFSISLTMPLQAADRAVDARPSARAEVQQLVDSFKHAILVKDGEAIRGMCLVGGAWFQVTDRTLRAENARERQISRISYEGFAKPLVASPPAFGKTFDNVRIETDGTVGIVWFDYRFLADGKLSHHGVECWQVVRDSDGWRISAILSSVIVVY